MSDGDGHLRFGTDDEEAFEAARDELVTGFMRWLDRTGHEVDGAGDARLALEWKWSHADGDLGWWRTGHLDRLLLEYYPRKVSSDPEDDTWTPVVLAALVNFLAATGRLTGASDPVEVLCDHLEDITDQFVDAMQDESRFGMAKSMLAGMDVDPTDPASIQAAMDAFNAQPYEQRRAVTDRGLAAMAPRPRTAPLRVAPRDQAAAAVVTAPWVRRLGDFVTWVGDGRRLTARGNLRLADGRELVELLDTGDRLSPLERLTSTTQLYRVDLTLRWALAAGLVMAEGTALRTTADGTLIAAGDADEVLDVFGGLVMAVLSLGVEDHFWGTRERVHGHSPYAACVDESVLPALMAVSEMRTPLSVEDWVEGAIEADEDARGFIIDERAIERRRNLVDDGVRRVLDVLAGLGLVEVEGESRRTVGAGSTLLEPEEWQRLVQTGDLDPVLNADDTREVREGGHVRLTPLGSWWLHDVLSDHAEVPVIGSLAGLPATELLARCPDLPADVAAGEVEVWLEDREPDQAAAELVSALPRTRGIARPLCLAALNDVGEVAVPLVEQLLEDRDLGPWAAVWLVERRVVEPIGEAALRAALEDGVEEVEEVEAAASGAVLAAVAADPDTVAVLQGDAAWQVGVLVAASAYSAGPDDLWLDLLAGPQAGRSEVIDLLGTWWRVPGGAAAEVLAGIGASHADKQVAKAARRALHRWRSAH